MMLTLYRANKNVLLVFFLSCLHTLCQLVSLSVGLSVSSSFNARYLPNDVSSRLCKLEVQSALCTFYRWSPQNSLTLK